MTDYSDLLNHYAPVLHQYGLWVVFGNLFLETLGMPLPGETLLIVAALLSSRGLINLPLLLFAGWSAAVLGDNAGFYIGRYGGRRLILRFGGKVGITHARVKKMEQIYQKYGPEIVIVARFFAIARQINGLVAGASGMNAFRFFVYNVLGAALWVGMWCIAAYYLGSSIQFLLNWFVGISLVIMTGTAVVFTGFMLYRIFSRKK